MEDIANLCLVVYYAHDRGRLVISKQLNINLLAQEVRLLAGNVVDKHVDSR